MVSYTRSKNIGDIEQQGFSGITGGNVQDFNNLRAERALALYDRPNNFVMSYVYDLPIGKGRQLLPNVSGFIDKAVSGWGINGITTLQSGAPLAFATSQNLTNSYGGGSRPNVAAGCDKSVSGSAQDRVDKWFNTACFSQPAAFTFGTESRTDPNLRGAGTANFDMSLFKRTQINERFSLTFRAEVFNLFNRVRFADPNTSFGNANFGGVTSQSNNPRLVQLALRLNF